MTKSLHVVDLAEVSVHMDETETGEYLVYITREGTEFHHQGVRAYQSMSRATKRFNEIVSTHRTREPREATREEINHLFGKPAGWGRFA